MAPRRFDRLRCGRRHRDALRRRPIEKRIDIFIVLCGFAIAFASDALHLAPLLVALVAGFTQANIWPERSERMFHSIERLLLPVYCVFFATRRRGHRIDGISRSGRSPCCWSAPTRPGVGGHHLRARLASTRSDPPVALDRVHAAGRRRDRPRERGRQGDRRPPVHSDIAALLLAAIAMNEVLGPLLMKWGLQRGRDTVERLRSAEIGEAIPRPGIPLPGTRLMFDTHCHLTFDCYEGRVDEVLAAALADGVRGCISISTTTGDLDRLVETGRARTSASGAPRACIRSTATARSTGRSWRRAGRHPKCVAWGELGLDRHYREPADRGADDPCSRSSSPASRRGPPKGSPSRSSSTVARRSTTCSRCSTPPTCPRPVRLPLLHRGRGRRPGGARLRGLVSFTGIVTFANAREVAGQRPRARRPDHGRDRRPVPHAGAPPDGPTQRAAIRRLRRRLPRGPTRGRPRAFEATGSMPTRLGSSASRSRTL